jgi:hypothetical protein
VPAWPTPSAAVEALTPVGGAHFILKPDGRLIKAAASDIGN